MKTKISFNMTGKTDPETFSGNIETEYSIPEMCQFVHANWNIIKESVSALWYNRYEILSFMKACDKLDKELNPPIKQDI